MCDIFLQKFYVSVIFLCWEVLISTVIVGLKGGFCASEVSSACRSSWWMTQNSTNFLCCNFSKTHKPHSWRMRVAHTHKTHTNSQILHPRPPSGWTCLPAHMTHSKTSSRANGQLWLIRPRVSVCLVGVLSASLCSGCSVCLAEPESWGGVLFWRVTGSEATRGHQCGAGTWWLTVRELMAFNVSYRTLPGWWLMSFFSSLQC